MTRLILIAVLLSSMPLAAQTYVAGGVAVGSAADVTLRDRDCGSTQPPALFGCGPGSDGVPLGAGGELRPGPGLELALGREAGRARAEVLFTWRSGRELDAEANFTGVTGEQPVRARVQSQSLLLVGAVDVAPQTWLLRPFIAAGAGVARNELGPVTFSFPAISPDAVTVAPGGDTTGFAWTGAAGVTMRLRGGLTIDVAMRYADLGRIRGDRGEATIVRPTRTLRLEIAETGMKWRTHEVTVTLRRNF